MNCRNEEKIQPADSFDVSKIILGFTGSIGSGCTYIAQGLPSVSQNRYQHFKLSDIIEENLKQEGIENATVQQKQDKGNELRKTHKGSILASELIERLKGNPAINDLSGIIIDGIKNVKEVQFLRQFPFFFLFSVQSETEIRCKRCVDGGVFSSKEDFYRADQRDELEEYEYGQQVKKCNYLSDIIISNNDPIQRVDQDRKKDFLTNTYRKYVRLIEALREGEPDPTLHPNTDELCMTLAYSLSKMSSCVKRKVGAVIIEKFVSKGYHKAGSGIVKELPYVVSSGYNEVPLGSHKCIYHPEYQMCHRDYLQEEHARQIVYCPNCGKKIQIKMECPTCGKTFDRFIKFCPECQREIEDNFSCPECGCEVFKKFLPGGKDSPGKLLDMCRALHAEENALLKLAKSGSNQKDLTLYVTTQPCNLCANKIVTTGISEVVFDAPYSMKESMEILKNGEVKVRRFQGVKSSAYFKLYQ